VSSTAATSAHDGRSRDFIGILDFIG